jgi:hypothetical protein
MCVLGWQAMLMLGLLIVFAQQIHLLFFLSAKNGFFCEAPTKKPF